VVVPNINDLLKSLIERVKNNDYGLEFVYEILQLGLLVVGWFREANPPVYGVTVDTELLARDLHARLNGQELVMTGPITDAVFVALVRALVSRAIDELDKSGLPQPVIDLVTRWLEELLQSLL
jgi:hypothetical protein